MNASGVNHIKTVLLGDAKVGKTSILNRQIRGYSTDDTKPTIGCNCSEMIVDPTDPELKPVKLEVFDTAGQELYRSLVPIYLRGAMAGLIVFDMTDPASFASVPQWHKLFVDNAKADAPIFLVGNKTDLVSKKEEGNNYVDELTVINYAKDTNAVFLKTSAATGEGVEDLFKQVAKSLAGATDDSHAVQKYIISEPKQRGCC